MNNDDLERQLRAQAGPREVGYQPTVLPATLEAEPRRSRPLSASRMALVGAAVLAGAALAIALTRVPQPAPSGVGAGGSPGPSPTVRATPTQPEPATCVAGDFAWSTDPWGGAAGSRGTNVLLRGVTSLTGCLIAGDVSVQIRDANGQVLVSATTTSHLRSTAGDVFEIGIAWSNWCGQDPAAPLTAALQLPGDATEVPLVAPGDAGIPVPPCNGEGQPSNLSVTEIQPSTKAFPDG